MSSKGTPLFPGLLPCSWSCVEAHEGSRGILSGTGWCQAAKAQLTGALPPLPSMGTSPIASLQICPGRLPWQSVDAEAGSRERASIPRAPINTVRGVPHPQGICLPGTIHLGVIQMDHLSHVCIHTYYCVCLTHSFQMCATQWPVSYTSTQPCAMYTHTSPVSLTHIHGHTCFPSSPTFFLSNP